MAVFARGEAVVADAREVLPGIPMPLSATAIFTGLHLGDLDGQPFVGPPRFVAAYFALRSGSPGFAAPYAYPQ